jgi:hypothetical protein
MFHLNRVIKKHDLDMIYITGPEHELAFQQVPGPGERRSGFADPSLERLQDRQPLHSCPHQP